MTKPKGKHIRVLVTGSRDWKDREVVWIQLSSVPWPPKQISLVYGGAKGADGLAAEYAIKYGWWRLLPYKPDWVGLGKRAGMVRNIEMVDSGVQYLFAFINECTKKNCTKKKPHGSHGSTQCVEYAQSLPKTRRPKIFISYGSWKPEDWERL